VFHVRADSGEPVYLQLMRQVKHAIATGALAPGDQLPTVRELAQTLVINPNPVARAYRELEHEGLLEASQGRGTFVRPVRPWMLLAERRRRLKPFIDALFAEGAALGFDPDEVAELAREEAAVRARGTPR